MNLGDTHSNIFIKNLIDENTEEYKISMDLFSCVLQCTNLPGMYPVDESSSIMSFSFWYTLQVRQLLHHLTINHIGSVEFNFYTGCSRPPVGCPKI